MLELVTSIYDDAYLWNLALGEEHELLGDYPWLRWIVQATDSPRLMAYRHRVTENFVLGLWVYSPDEAVVPLVSEVRTFAGVPTDEWPDGLPPPHVMRRILAPIEVQRERARQARLEAASAKRRSLEGDRDSKQEAYNYLKGRGMVQEAAMLKNSPWKRPSEDTAASAASTAKFVRNQF